MKLTAHQSLLEDAIRRVLPAAASKSTLPILAHVLLEYDGTTLTVAATDLEISLSHTTTIEGGEAGAVTLPGKQLADLVAKMPDAALTLTVNDRHQATLTAGEAEYTLFGLPAGEYPAISRSTDGETLLVPAQELLTLIKRTLFATSDDQSRVVLTGILLERAGHTLAMVATDTHRMTVATLRHAQDGAEVTAIIPARAAKEMARAIGKAEDPVVLRFHENMLTVGIDHLTMGSRLIEGTFPDYRRVLPSNPAITATLGMPALLEAIGRAEVIARGESNKLFLDVADGHLVLRADTTEYGKARERLTATVEGEAIQTAANAEYLREAIAAFGAPTVQFGFTAAASPILLTADEVPDYVCVVMPMTVL